MKKITSAQSAFIIRIIVEAMQSTKAAGKRLLEAGFTGQKKDKLGHTRYYQDGRQVKNPNAKEKANINAAAGKPLPAGQAPSHADAATRVNALHADAPPEHVAALANDLMNMSVEDLTKLAKTPEPKAAAAKAPAQDHNAILKKHKADYKAAADFMDDADTLDGKKEGDNKMNEVIHSLANELGVDYFDAYDMLEKENDEANPDKIAAKAADAIKANPSHLNAYIKAMSKIDSSFGHGALVSSNQYKQDVINNFAKNTGISYNDAEDALIQAHDEEKKKSNELAPTASPDKAPTAAADKPGFTGTDSQGRQWQDGELVAAKDKPTDTAAAAAGMNADALALDALRLKANKKPHNAAHLTPNAIASLKQQGFIDAANKLTNDGRAHLYLQKGKAVRKAIGPAKPQAAAAPAPGAPTTNMGADADALEALRLKSNKKQHNAGHITPDAVASLKRQGFIDEGNKLTPEGRLHLAAQKFSNAPKPTGAPKPKWKRAARNKDSLISIVKRRGGINSDSVKAGYDYQADIVEGGLLHAIRKQGTGLDEMAATLQLEGHIIVPEGMDPGEHLLNEMKARHHSALRNTDKEIESEEQAYYKAKQEALERGDDERDIESSRSRGAQTGESAGKEEGARAVDEWDNSGTEAQGSGENAAVTGDGYDSADASDYDRNAGQDAPVDTSFDFGANVDEPAAPPATTGNNQEQPPSAAAPAAAAPDDAVARHMIRQAFTGIDAQGRQWQNGELVAAKDDKPAAPAGKAKPEPEPKAEPTPEPEKKSTKFENPGDVITPSSQSRTGENPLEVLSIKDGWALVGYANRPDGPRVRMPSESLDLFRQDQQGRVDLPDHTGSEAIDKISNGKGKLLGSGDDGLAYDAGDKVVKVSTTAHFHAFGHEHRSPAEAVHRLKGQAEINNDMIKAGVPGLLPQTFEEHGNRGFITMEKLDTTTKLTPEQVDEVARNIEAMHKLGYVLGDQIQVGIDFAGHPKIFDTGKAVKAGSGGYSKEDHFDYDNSNLERFFKDNGLTYEDPEQKKLTNLRDSTRAQIEKIKAAPKNIDQGKAQFLLHNFSLHLNLLAHQTGGVLYAYAMADDPDVKKLELIARHTIDTDSFHDKNVKKLKPMDAPAPAAAAPDQPGFTGTDSEGREWQNGKLVAAKDDGPAAPAGKAASDEPNETPTAKEPWEMTRANLPKKSQYDTVTHVDTQRFGKIPITDALAKLRQGIGLGYGGNRVVTAHYPDGTKQSLAGDLNGFNTMSGSEVITAKDNHYNAVKAALDAGKNVSPEVLADYPDLQPKTPAPAAAAPDPDPVTEPSTPAAAAAQPQPDDTPRTAAARVSAAMEGDFENARASAVPNMGKDLKGSARHKAMAWKGLQDAEANGTAEALVKRDELLKHDPSNLSSILDADNFLEVLTGHLAMQAFPKEVHNYAQYVSNINEHKSTPAELREQYYEAFTEIKKIVEEGPAVEVDHKEITRNINKKLKELISKFRKEGQGEPSPRLGKNYDGDRYNPVANSLINMQQRILNDGPASVLGKVNDFGRRLQKTTKDGRPSAETLNLAIKATGDILEGKSFNQAFDTVEKKAAGFDYSLAYGTKITRTGGKKIDMSEQSTSSPGAKVFMDDMKVRGVQFGNSLPDQERVYHAEKSAEALSDLTSILGLPDDAAGLGGKLGLAIGARGKAGAAAHFEPWQADNDASGTAGGPVINLTRANGAGSLAHEWGHGLDHFAANNGPGGKKFVSKGNGSNLSPLTSKAMKKVQEAMDASGFSSRLEEEIKLIPAEKQRHNLNTKTERDYWRSPEEKFARTFERHVQNKLHEAGRENTYLTGLHKVGHPLWPTNEEMAHIAPHMDALIAAIAAEKFPNHKMPAPAPAAPRAASPAPAAAAPAEPKADNPAHAAWIKRGSNPEENRSDAFQAVHGKRPTFQELHGGPGGLVEKLKGQTVKSMTNPSSTITDVTPAGYGPGGADSAPPPAKKETAAEQAERVGIQFWAQRKFKNIEHAKNFANWFKGSKVKNENNEPLVVYHGASEDFDTFSNQKSRTGDSTEGFWMASNPDEANEYSFSKGTYKGIIKPTYLQVQNPYIVDAKGKDHYDPLLNKQAIEEAKKGGHDGVIIKNYSPAGHKGDYYFVFSPNQIKSATGNRGTYDPNSPKTTEATMPTNEKAQKIKLVQAIIARKGIKPPQPKAQAKKTPEASGDADPRVKRIRELMDAYC